MKKLLFVFSIVFILSACDEYGVHDNIIYNDSSYDITFSLKKTDTYTVQSGKSIAVKSQIGAVVETYESSTPKRVDYVQTDTRKGKFVDLPSISVVINNTMSIPVTLSAGGYLDVDPMLNITANSDDSTNAIYTRTPVFTVSTSSFPGVADFQIVDDVMYVIVR
jgi:hypothetical protein